MRVRARAYDLVLNGTELGSGSIRIHDPEMQQRVFSGLGMSREDAERRFGFLLNAFRYGAPPHGGFAYGLDRVVMLAAGEETIREVIAFPKNQQAEEPMTDAPAPADPKQLRELGLELARPAVNKPDKAPAETVTVVFRRRYRPQGIAIECVRYATYSRQHERRHLHKVRERSHSRVRFDRCFEHHGLRTGRPGGPGRAGDRPAQRDVHLAAVGHHDPGRPHI